MSKHFPISINEAISCIKAGGIAALPTETVYGLAGRISDDRALAAIFAAKGRPADNPLIVHVAEKSDVGLLAHTNSMAENLMNEFWPGPLTLVLPKKNSVSVSVTAGLDTVAVRMPSNEIMLAVIRGVGEPLAAPSANRSGRPSPTSAQHVIDDHSGVVPVVDGGTCVGGLESTIVRIDGNRAVLLRPGAITREQIARVVGIDVEELGVSDIGRSPGTIHKHYKPSAKVTLVRDVGSIDVSESERKKLLILSTNDPELGINWRYLAPETLYAELRNADNLHVDEILVLCDQVIIQNEALMNRLLRASESDTDDETNT